MSASIKPSSRYSSFDNRSSSSSHMSDPSSSAELKTKHSSLKRLIGVGSGSGGSASRGMFQGEVSKPKSSDLVKVNVNVKTEQNLSSMVKKFMEKRSGSSSKISSKTAMNGTGLVIAADILAENLKKPVKKESNFTALQRKLFNKGSTASSNSGAKSEMKALTEVKSNTRTLAMVLRSERELLSQNKDLETEIAELKLIVEQKNYEAEKLKDLCLKQREELKSLKSAVLFPDVMNTQLQTLYENQGLELKQAKQVIPTLQRQVSSLTGQLQCLAEDLAEVKADKYSAQASFESQFRSPTTPASYDQEASDSLDFSSGNCTNPGSPDDMFIKDLNPLLTPFAKSKSNEFLKIGYNSPNNERSYSNTSQASYDTVPNVRKLSRSSDYHQNSEPMRTATRGARRSDGIKSTFRNPMNHRQF